MQTNSKLYTFFNVFSKTVVLLSNSLNQWKIYLSYAATLAIIGFLFNFWNNSCLQNPLGFVCSEYIGIASLILQIILHLMLFLLFAINLYSSLIKHIEFSLWQIFSLNCTKLRQIGFLFFYIISLSVPWLIVVILIKNPANPDWRIEFVYFMITFVMGLVPLLAMRFSASIGYYMQNMHYPKLSQLYNITIGKSYIGIIGFLIIMQIFVIVNIKMLSVFNHVENASVMLLFTYFADYLFKLFFVAFALLFCQAQHEIIELSQTKGVARADNPSAVVETALVTKPKKTTKKTHKKSKKEK